MIGQGFTSGSAAAGPVAPMAARMTAGAHRPGRRRPEGETWSLAAEPTTAATARGLAREALRRWCVAGEDAEDIVLIVDELVTNAVVHGRGPVTLSLRRQDGLVRGEVGDCAPPEDPEAPPAALPGGDAGGVEWGRESGRGLWLVTMLSADHGLRPEPGGKTMWFTRALTA